MSLEQHLEEAKKPYQEALAELKRVGVRGDRCVVLTFCTRKVNGSLGLGGIN